MCVFVRVLKPPNETLSEPQPAPLATIMTTLLRTIGCQQNQTVSLGHFVGAETEKAKRKE